MPTTGVGETLHVHGVHRAIARREGEVPETPATTDERLVAGGKLYMNGCAGCHGELGKAFEEDRNLSARAATATHRHATYRTTNLLDREARNSHDRDVRIRKVLLRTGTVVDRGVYSSNPQL